MKSKLILCCVCGLASVSVAYFSNVRAADLLDIYNLARDNDPLYQTAQYTNQANQYDLPLAKSALKPKLTALYEPGEEYSEITGEGNTSDNKRLNVKVVMPIFDLPKITAVRQAKKSTRASELQFLEARQNLILRVAAVYFNVLAAQDAREVAQAERIAVNRQMDLAAQRLAVGIGTPADLFDAKARFKQAEADELRTENTINNQLALLKQIIGVAPDELRTLKKDAPLDTPQPNNLDDWISKSETGNLEFKVDQLNLGIALDEIKRRQNALWPVLSIESNYNEIESEPNFSNFEEDYVATDVSLKLSYSLYSGGAAWDSQKQAGLQYNAAEQRLEQSRRAAATEATAAFLDVTSGITQIEALSDAITAGESAFEAKQQGFNAGLTTNLDVLDAQRDLSRSRTDYLRARYNYILSVLQLQAAIGDLDETDIARVNEWLE